MGGILGSSGGLTPDQTKQLQAMLKATKTPATSIPPGLLGVGTGTGTTPVRTSAANLAQDARMTILQRQGYKATVATSPLGDAGFGTALSRPVI